MTSSGALDAYMKLLASKGADTSNLARRKQVLAALLPHLSGKPVNPEAYRDAVETCIERLDKQDLPFFMTLARDFYYFWSNDIKAIVALQKNGAFSVAPSLPDIPADSLQDLWAKLDTEKLGLTEKWPVTAYRAAMRNEGLDKQVIDTRTRMVRLLVIQLRQVHERNGLAYRQAVESLLPLFTHKETRAMFLGIVREFFPFWLGDPNAPGNRQADEPDSPTGAW